MLRRWPYWLKFLLLSIVIYLLDAVLILPVFVLFDGLQFIAVLFLLTSPFGIPLLTIIGIIVDWKKGRQIKIGLIVLLFIILPMAVGGLYKTGFFFDGAVASNDVAMCNLLVPENPISISERNRQDCYYMLVVKNKNKIVCENKLYSKMAFSDFATLFGGSPQDHCWNGLAQKSKNADFCNLIDNRKIKKDFCLDYFGR